MDNGQAKRELCVFRLFLEVRGIACPEDALKKRCPPEPDLLFRHPDGSIVAYELVELVDQCFARTLGGVFETKEGFETYFRSRLPPEKKNSFLRLYGDADLFFQFGQGTTQNQRRKVLPVAFEKLLALPDGTSDEVLKNEPDLLPTLISVWICRGVAGPVFDSESYVRMGNPGVPLIQQKFGKRYVTSHPIELLAYRYRNPRFPDNAWLAQLRDFIYAQSKPLPFRRILIFDCCLKQIIFECAGF